MSTLLHLAPGESAPSAGVFALVGRAGEPTGIAIWRNEGEELPHMTVTKDIGPLRFIQVGNQASITVAA